MPYNSIIEATHQKSGAHTYTHQHAYILSLSLSLTHLCACAQTHTQHTHAKDSDTGSNGVIKGVLSRFPRPSPVEVCTMSVN